MMILGAAFQNGWVPLPEESILAAIGESVRRADVEANHHAFRLGRHFAARPELAKPEHQRNVRDGRRVRDGVGAEAADFFHEHRVGALAH